MIYDQFVRPFRQNNFAALWAASLLERPTMKTDVMWPRIMHKPIVYHLIFPILTEILVVETRRRKLSSVCTRVAIITHVSVIRQKKGA